MLVIPALGRQRHENPLSSPFDELQANTKLKRKQSKMKNPARTHTRMHMHAHTHKHKRAQARAHLHMHAHREKITQVLPNCNLSLGQRRYKDQ